MQSMYKVIFADITLSFDNVIGVVGASKDNYTLMIFGLFLSVILIGTLAVLFLGLDTRTVGDIAPIGGVFPPFHLPDVPLSIDMLKIVFPYAIVMALVGLIESLLTLNLIDDLKRYLLSTNC